jgi:uncharacterized protein (DUF433 family)
MTLPDFITQDPDGFLRLSGHRIGLHHVVRLYQDGYTPELLAEYYPTLPLALVHKVIAFYLENRVEVDGYVAREQADFERRAAAPQPGPGLAELQRRLEARRRSEAS